MKCIISNVFFDNLYQTEYPSDEFTVTAKDINEALYEVREMIQKKTVLVVDLQKNYWGKVVYCRLVNMGMVTKFEIFKSCLKWSWLFIIHKSWWCNGSQP
ncbi:hypothetical protein [Psychrobacillus sp. OK032]|uniref:hypothetical protein n=1 Tax=Psychrobacillus sp. OK032 TaxID=1884358 RepID=UPI000B83ED13|nr:hypothetical protein [Psychrobacillus sp. OK032]